MSGEKLDKVVLIDDDEVANFIYGKVIANAEISQDITTFQSASDGLDYINRCIEGKEKLPQIIFLDINMPVMNGWDFLNEYKKVPTHIRNQINIFMLSSSLYQEDIDKAKSFKEVNDYITKPLTKEKLLEIQHQYFNTH